MEIRLNKGAAYLFCRPMVFNGLQVKPGDLVPSSITEKKLRMLHNTGRIILGVGQAGNAQPQTSARK